MLDTCLNTHGNTTDKDGYTCEAYTTDASCGKYDDGDFDSYKKCCSCGGGAFGKAILEAQFFNSKLTIIFYRI